MPRSLTIALRAGAAMLLVLLSAAGVLARQEDLPSALERLRDFPAPIALGMRALALEQHVVARSTLVIVPDSARVVALISRWDVGDRFPVLIDDGTDASRQDIARFVRAYEPGAILRWEGDVPQLPDKPARLREAVDGALYRSWGTSSRDELLAKWKDAGFIPPGVCVASPRDPAWTGALALGAARGMEIVWTDGRPRNIGAVMKTSDLDALDSAITGALDASGFSWRSLGDEIDAVALCRNVQTRLPIDNAKGHLALTDRIGRFPDGRRWAWCAMTFGSEREALHRAMCAIFLRPRRAWLFDGYPQGMAEPFALSRAEQVLTTQGLDAVADLPPEGGAAQWRFRASGGVDADLVLVNTKGSARWFDVSPGRLYASDIPLLAHPACVSFIHSFSAQRLNDPQSIAARWFASGAYAYVGSVHEPFLGAFQPGETLLTRLLMSRVPWGAACRIDNAPAWKINVFGDPLMTWGRPLARSDEALSLPGARDIEQDMRANLGAGRYPEALADLVILARDEVVVRFVGALAREDERKVTPEIAREALHSAFRMHDHDLFAMLYAQVLQPAPVDRDLLWQIARARALATSERDLDESLVGLLRASIRDESAGEDASLLAPAMLRLYSREAVARMYDELIGRVTDKRQLGRLRQEARLYADR